jgi:hypothetical protein
MLLYILGFSILYLYYKYNQQEPTYTELPFDVLYSFSNDLSRSIYSNKIENIKRNEIDTNDFILCNDINDIMCKSNFVNIVKRNELNLISNIKLLLYTYNNSNDEILEYLINYCKINNIILYIVSDIHPNEFNFNTKNYITPYHYRTNFFGYYEKTSVNNEKSSIKLSEIRNNIIYNYKFDNKEILIVL